MKLQSDDPRLLKQIQTIALRVRNPQTAERLWLDHLSPAQRESLGGNFKNSYTNDHGIIGMYRRLYRVDELRALLDLGRLFGFLPDPNYNSLLRRFEFDAAPGAARVPQWNRDSLELMFAGTVVRRIERPTRATNLLRVLNTFEDDHWPPRIDDPLPGGPNQLRVHNTIQSLNKRLTLVRFSADGSGEGFRWHEINFRSTH